MQRRKFLELGAIAGGGMFLSACNSSNNPDPVPEEKPVGAVTYYTEIRVPGPEKATVLGKIDQLMADMLSKTGYLSLSFKQMTGESTMVKNYPNEVKGVLDQRYIGNPKVPNFYSLFVRFENYDNLVDSGIQQWFQDNIVPSLFAYKVENGAPVKTPIVLEYHEGVYVTVAAGDKNAIYTTQDEIKTFLQNQADEVGQNLVTVENHVMIKDVHLAEFNTKVKNLLTVAQQTYMPNDGSGNGITGTLDVDNTDYRKAVTTEILQNAFPDGDLRAYLMHGVWESVADHENSHIDVRFQQAAGPVGAYVVVGPVEPFYDTIKQDNNNA